MVCTGLTCFKRPMSERNPSISLSRSYPWPISMLIWALSDCPALTFRPSLSLGTAHNQPGFKPLAVLIQSLSSIPAFIKIVVLDQADYSELLYEGGCRGEGHGMKLGKACLESPPLRYTMVALSFTSFAAIPVLSSSKGQRRPQGSLGSLYLICSVLASSGYREDVNISRCNIWACRMAHSRRRVRDCNATRWTRAISYTHA